MAPRIEMDGEDVPAVRRLAQTVEAADGIAAFDEQTLLNLDSPTVTHLLLGADQEAEQAAEQEPSPIGYAQIDQDSAELAIHPDHRHRGWGTHLLTEVLRHAPNAAIWAHGNLPGAQALADQQHLVPVRELLYLSAYLDRQQRPTQQQLATAGVRITTFTPGTADETDWIALNAAAFADHPEQGRLALADLHERMAQDWFDPSLFWLARDPDGRLLGAMWVKPSPANAEIYVLGVHPQAQGRRLGTVLTQLALAEVGERGWEQMDLYVEGDNTPAVATYARHGFTTAQRHVQFRRS